MTHSSQKKSKSKERSVSASLKPHKRPKNRDRGVFFESLKPTEQQKKPKRKSRDRSVSSEPPEQQKKPKSKRERRRSTPELPNYRSDSESPDSRNQKIFLDLGPLKDNYKDKKSVAKRKFTYIEVGKF